ncbi:hypothetical protein DITRI_Ditri20bG0141100 [Diplodiscus trichospermus]
MSSYLLVVIAVACLSIWLGFNIQPFTWNTIEVRRLFANTKATPPIDFYKLSLQWPPSSCNSGKMNCTLPIGHEFTIHGLWPQDRNDKPIPPYNKSNPCTNVTPTPATDLPIILAQIQGNLTSLWPNLTNPQNLTANLQFWGYEWTKHGTCSDYPNQPLDYFKAALQLRKGFNPVMGLIPGSQYTVQYVANQVQKLVKAYPEIACNKVNKTLQLWEIRICYDRPPNATTVKNCPKKFSGQCKSMADVITFPN